MDRPIVVGGGLSGLVACLTLEKAGHAPILCEASDALGGRLKTDWVEGVPLDRGFQVLLTAYPEVKRLLDLEALEVLRFDAGARVFPSDGGAPVLLGDPRRKLADLRPTLSSGLASMGDAWRLLRHLRRVKRPRDLDALFSRDGAALDTEEALRRIGYSTPLVESFFRPFFGGIFLDRSLSVPVGMFDFVLRMFATGDAVIPRQGMAAVPAQLAAKLERTTVHLETSVDWVAEDGSAVRTSSGETLSSRGVILATPGMTRDVEGAVVRDAQLNWFSTVRYVWSVSPDVRRFERPLIGLLPGTKHLTNMHFFKDLDAEGPDWVSVTAAGDAEVIHDEKAMRQAFHRASGIAVRDLVVAQSIPHALPVSRPLCDAPDPESLWLVDGVLRAGDDRSNPSFNGAARAGAVAGETLAQWMC